MSTEEALESARGHIMMRLENNDRALATVADNIVTVCDREDAAALVRIARDALRAAAQMVGGGDTPEFALNLLRLTEDD